MDGVFFTCILFGGEVIAIVARSLALVIDAFACAMGDQAVVGCAAAVGIIAFCALSAAWVVIVDTFRSDAYIAFAFAICPAINGFGAVDIVRTAGHG